MSDADVSRTSGAATGNEDAAFLDVDEADVETSTSDEQGRSGPTHGDAEQGTDSDDVTMSKITDALDSDAIAASGSPIADETGSER